MAISNNPINSPEIQNIVTSREGNRAVFQCDWNGHTVTFQMDLQNFVRFLKKEYREQGKRVDEMKSEAMLLHAFEQAALETVHVFERQIQNGELDEIVLSVNLGSKKIDLILRDQNGASEELLSTIKNWQSTFSKELNLENIRKRWDEPDFSREAAKKYLDHLLRQRDQAKPKPSGSSLYPAKGDPNHYVSDTPLLEESRKILKDRNYTTIFHDLTRPDPGSASSTPLHPETLDYYFSHAVSSGKSDVASVSSRQTESILSGQPDSSSLKALRLDREELPKTLFLPYLNPESGNPLLIVVQLEEPESPQCFVIDPQGSASSEELQEKLESLQQLLAGILHLDAETLDPPERLTFTHPSQGGDAICYLSKAADEIAAGNPFEDFEQDISSDNALFYKQIMLYNIVAAEYREKAKGESV